MELQLLPEPDEPTADAVSRAVVQAGVDLRDVPLAYRSPWRRAALVESATKAELVAEQPVSRD